MITDNLIRKVEDFVYGEEKRNGVPSKYQLDFTNIKGQWLAEKLGGNKKIIFLGTLLMDCMLGKAYSEGRLGEHIKMSTEKATILLSEDKDITNEEKENIIYCVKEHHGLHKFHSLESEICCNADCYIYIHPLKEL